MAKKKKKPKTTAVHAQKMKTRFSSMEISVALDDTARVAALKARLIGLAPIVLFAVLIYNYRSIANPYVVASIVVALVVFAYSSYLVHKVFVEAVWRGRHKSNRTLYRNNKKYFDERFTRYGLREEA